MNKCTSILNVAALILSTAICVESHGYLSQPAATYVDTSTMTSYITRVDATQLFPGYKWNDSPQANSLQYKNLVNAGSVGQLKDFMDKYVSGCPENSLTNVVSVDGLSSMKWQNDQYMEGFISSHTGPCEAWIDNTKVFSNVDCAATYTAYPAEIPIDFSKCTSGKCLFEFYWEAIHEPMWQLYKGCVYISVTTNTYTSQTGSSANSTQQSSYGASNTISGTIIDSQTTKKFNCTLE